MFGQDREQLRGFYHEVWRKHAAGEPLAGVELIVAQIVEAHPEYHPLISRTEVSGHDYNIESGETNPYLHMGMHIALAEQLQTDRPAGIRALYRELALRCGDAHEAEHRMMDCLGLILWEAQRNNSAPDEPAYLDCIKKLLAK